MKKLRICLWILTMMLIVIWLSNQVNAVEKVEVKPTVESLQVEQDRDLARFTVLQYQIRDLTNVIQARDLEIKKLQETNKVKEDKKK
jgi:hypothetical protein